MRLFVRLLAVLLSTTTKCTYKAKTLFVHKIMWNANLMQIGNSIDVFLARHVSGTYAHHQEPKMLS